MMKYKSVLCLFAAGLVLLAGRSWADDKTAAAPTPAPPAPAAKPAKAGNQTIAAIQAAIDLDTAGNTTAAIAAFEKVGVLKSKNLEAWRLTDEANTYIKAGDNTKATSLLEQATETNPKNYVAWNNLGTMYEGTGDMDKAKDAYQKSVDAAKAANASSAKAEGNLEALQARMDKAAAKKAKSGAKPAPPPAGGAPAAGGEEKK